MREKNRKPIASIKKLPQFTTMNVIDGQAGLISYFSLIFYSLTIDNILNIIVLLILAGVTIATLTGDNGILTKAQEASENTKRANAEEQVKLAVQASYGTDGKINMDTLNNELKKIERLTYKGSPISDSNKITSLPDTVNVDGYDVTINGNGSVGDNGGNDNTETIVEGVTIPEGFYYVGGSKAEGIVISDNAEDENKGTSWEVAEYNAMKDSVLEHNGFYVGRYEAGTTSTTERTGSSGIEDKVVVKQGANVYNWIGWSNSNDMTDETGGAVEKAKEFASEQGYTSVTSTLIYGVQWDAIMQWIDPKYQNEDGTLTSFVADSTGKGNYSEDENTNPWKGNLITTGASADYAVKNIYDLAGNVSEWTMECYDTFERISRGGCYYNTGFQFPVSNCGDISQAFRNDVIGFRIAFYL